MPPWRRAFAWKFSWFMTRFYSIFYNRAAHFCSSLVVAVVMPQYSAVTRLQRAFCSHAPSQKHRVTSLASSGKGAPAGLFCSPLVCFFSFLSVFIVFSSLSRLFFFLLPLSILPRRFTLDGIKLRARGERAMLVIQVLVCGISMRQRADCPYSERWMWLFWMWRCIGGDHSASGPALLCHCDPPVGEAVRATAGGRHWKAT